MLEQKIYSDEDIPDRHSECVDVESFELLKLEFELEKQAHQRTQRELIKVKRELESLVAENTKLHKTLNDERAVSLQKIADATKESVGLTKDFMKLEKESQAHEKKVIEKEEVLQTREKEIESLGEKLKNEKEKVKHADLLRRLNVFHQQVVGNIMNDSSEPIDVKNLFPEFSERSSFGVSGRNCL